MPLRISFLGAQSVTDRVSGEVRGQSSRAVAVLAYLVLHAGVPQSRQHIAGVLWPDSTDAQALTNLRRELHAVRRMLGEHACLTVTAKDLCWRDDPQVEADLSSFEAARAAAIGSAKDGDHEQALRHAVTALGCYQGELLPGLYDEWVIEPRDELRRRCAELCALVTAWRTRQGDLSGALTTARRRVALAPLEEAGYRTLMAVQADFGDRAGAVSTYHQCASILERELGVVPDDATQAVLRQVMTSGGKAARRSDTSPPEPVGARAGSGAGRLIGRAAELAVLDGAWRTASRGRASLAVVCGGAGVGKTRLVTEIADVAAREGSVVAVSQCFGTSGRLALAPVADWLRHPAVQSAAARVDPVWRNEVERLVPGAAGRGDPVDGSRAMVDAWQRLRFFEGLARGLLAADRPTLVVLDNLQWCDQETLTFLTFALGFSPRSPLLVAATLRTDSPGGQDDADEWLVRMRAAGVVTEVALSPLDAPDTGRLGEAITGRPLTESDRSVLQAATGGFPLHVVETLRAVQDLGVAQLPASDLGMVLQRRLEQADPTAQEVAGLAAAVGRDFTLDLLVEASDCDADAVVRAVDELWRRRIVTESGDRYDFSHDLLRDAAYAQVSPPRRWLLHRRLAQSLELLHADDTTTVSAQLAQQYARGGHPMRAVAYYLRAAEVAAGIFGHAEATRLHREALALVRAQPPGGEPARQELTVLEAMAAPLNARNGYASTELQSVLEQARDLAESLGRTDSLLNALVGLFASRFVQGRIDDAHRTAARAVELATPGSEQAGAAHFALAGSAVSLGMPQEALRHFARAAELTQGASVSVGTRPDVHGLAWAAHAHWLLGQDDLALASCRDAVALARSINHPYSVAVALAYAGVTHQMRDDRAELTATVAELSQLCRRYGFGYYREWALVLDGWNRGGTAGTDLARQGIANLRAEGSFARMPYWLALLADLVAGCGRLDAARSTLDSAAASAVARSDVWWLPEVQRRRARHDPDDDVAVQRLRAAADLAAAHGSLALLARCERDLADRGVGGPESPVR
jgi:DNA-binding SARP family transcriptional activator